MIVGIWVKKYESLNGMKLPGKEKMPLFIREDICLKSVLDQTKCVDFPMPHPYIESQII